MTLKERLALFGYVKISGLLSGAEADEILRALADVTGYGPETLPWVQSRKIPTYAAHNYGLEIPIFRKKLATHPRVLEILRDVVGPDIKILQDGISAMWSAAGLHRDNHLDMDMFKDEPIDADSPDRCAVIRVLHYFLPPGVQTKFAVVAGSHKPRLAQMPSPGGLKISDITQQEHWMPINHGDCVIFDSRLQHMGPLLSEPRYMVNYTYSLPNSFGREEWYYRRYVRTDHCMEPWSDGVVADLKASGLWFDDPEEPSAFAALEEKFKDTPRGHPKIRDRVINRSLCPSRYLDGSRYAYLNETLPPAA